MASWVWSGRNGPAVFVPPSVEKGAPGWSFTQVPESQMFAAKIAVSSGSSQFPLASNISIASPSSLPLKASLNGITIDEWLGQ